MRRFALLLTLATFVLCAGACTRAPDRATLPGVETPADPLAGRWIGYYIPEVPTETAPLAELERKTGQPAAVSHYFLGVAVEPFNTRMAENAASHGSVPMITLEFWDFRKRTPDQPAFSLARIEAGDHDPYLRRFARDAKAFGGTVLLRPLHEMNGSWYPWGGTVNTNVPAEFVGAWRHVHDVFALEGANNVHFVWSPNAESVPASAENAIAAYWPGDEYVDYVALDGYNGGRGEEWRGFDEVFRDGYHSVTALTDRPLLVAETACADSGGDKAAWVDNMFDSLTHEFSDVVGVVWFNEHKEHDWRIESSVESLGAFRDGAAQWTAGGVPAR